MITCTDMFCGAGGSSSGASMAGCDVKLAINHSARAIETHNTNFPNTKHILTDLQATSARKFPKTDILIASPECTNHSIAKGHRMRVHTLWEDFVNSVADDVAEKSRCTMWTPLEWAEHHRYQSVIMENVVDCHKWAPFRAWLAAWDSLDYVVEQVSLNSMFVHPTPQSRDRLYLIATKKGNRRPNLAITPLAYCEHCQKDIEAVQVWKNGRKVGKYKGQYVYNCPNCVTKEVFPYYYPAAAAIDWSIPTTRIGDRKRPLTKKTMERIQYGIEKFSKSFLLNLNHGEPRPTEITTSPSPTQTSYDSRALVLRPPFLMDHLAEYRPRPITGAASTVCASGNHHSVIIPPTGQQYIMTYYKHGQLYPIQEASPTATTVARHALITTETEQNIEDYAFRMLDPEEIQAIMAFPSDYVITGNRAEKVEQLGNAVTPPVMRVLMQRVLDSLK